MNKEIEFLKKIGATNIEKKSSIKNYSIKFDFNNKRYIVRHILNEYGVNVDFWELQTKTILQRDTIIEFKSLEDIINFLKFNLVGGSYE